LKIRKNATPQNGKFLIPHSYFPFLIKKFGRNLSFPDNGKMSNKTAVSQNPACRTGHNVRWQLRIAGYLSVC
jgi:hypothetical protein